MKCKLFPILMLLSGCSTDVFTSDDGGDSGAPDSGLPDSPAAEASSDAANGDAGEADSPDALPKDGGGADSDAGTTAPYKVGDYTAFLSSSAFNAGYLLGEAVTLTKPATLLDFGLIQSTTGAYGVMALYSDTGGLPDKLLAYTSSTALTGGDQQIAPNSNIALAAGTYWIMATYDKSVMVQTDSSTTNPRNYISFTFGDPLPSTLSGLTTHYGVDFNYYLVVQ